MAAREDLRAGGIDRDDLVDRLAARGVILADADPAAVRVDDAVAVAPGALGGERDGSDAPGSSR